MNFLELSFGEKLLWIALICYGVWAIGNFFDFFYETPKQLSRIADALEEQNKRKD